MKRKTGSALGRPLVALMVTAGLGFMVSASSALTVGGNVVYMGAMPAGLDLRKDKYEHNTQIRMFFESEVVLDDDLFVDWHRDSGLDTPDGPLLTQGYIGAGTTLKSYLLHYDPVGENWRTASGFVSFEDELILGVIFTSTQLLASDGILGSPTTTYASGDGRRTEIQGYGDATNPTGNYNNPDSLTNYWATSTLHAYFQTGPHIDQVRIVTVAKTTERIPDGGITALLLMSALYGMRYVRRKR